MKVTSKTLVKQALLSVNVANRLIKYIEMENLIDEFHTSFPKKKKLV